MPTCASLSAIRIVDARLDQSIGKRYVETSPSITAPISASSDVAAWVKAGAAETAQRNPSNGRIPLPQYRPHPK